MPSPTLRRSQPHGSAARTRVQDVPAAPRVSAAAVGRGVALAAIAWGALAFGGAYPWAYWPLAGAAVLVGLLGLKVPADRAVSRGLIASLVVLVVAGALQLVPLPLGALHEVSPNAARLVQDLDFAVGAGVKTAHPLSIDPGSTLVGIALLGAFALLLAGMARLLSTAPAARFVEALTAFAVVLALAGIVQKPVYTGYIYGFWEPRMGGNPFGPFVNKNHFAGWMLMALPLALALLCAGLERAMHGLKPGWRYRILWLSSPEANRLILIAAAAAVMALALVLTMSRSGISALALSLLMTGAAVLRHVRGRSRKAAGAAYLLLLAVTIVGWVGADAIVTRFSHADWTEFNSRRGAWADAIDVARSFPLAGTGLNTYDTAARFYQRNDLKHHFGESHNDYLQVAAEGGLLVALPALACLAVLARDVYRRLKEDRGTTSWWLRRGAVTALVAIALQETVEFSLQMPGNAVLFAVVCAIALHRRPAPRAEPEPEPVRARLQLVVLD